ncbi:MAG: M20 family metallo-hydrolase [Thermoplasmatales archaeon]|jgi:succinyl-diaminopimelate desuccinylase|nr:M20 family metallo-hydrolase [Candidatus Thermoplasmatota archaeon]MDA8055387.1 M20 family metallo-hydrolase [Thermoplasmatales archaeon]
MTDRDYFLKLYSKMIEINSVNPAGGGRGERWRADFLKEEITKWSKELRFEEYIAESDGIKRPNLLFLFDRGKEKTIWFVAHMDTVAEGDLSLWKYPPFKATIEGDRVYGRGTCDNGQGGISSLYALKYFIGNPDQMKNNIGVILVSDEEAGSKYGIQYVLQNRKFTKNDKFIVPDYGTPIGDSVEVAEKGALWLKITVIGQQCHASTPDMGKNAHRLGRELEMRIDKRLHSKFNASDGDFTVPKSTFEPTKIEPGTTSINIIPGKESFYFDMRILPTYSIDVVLNEVKSVSDEFKKEYGVDVQLETVNRANPSSNTPKGKEFVDKFIQSVKKIKGIEVKKVGIGGGTCGAFFRNEGLDTIVWGTLDETEHMPNEYAKISNIFGDADVFVDFVGSQI